MAPVGLGFRLTIPLACLLGGYAALHAYLDARNQRVQLLTETELSTLRLVDTVKRSTRFAMLNTRREDVHRIIENIGQQDDIEHVRIFNKEGAIMYSSDLREMGTVVDRDVEACYQCHDTEQPLSNLDQSERTRMFQGNDGNRVLAAIDVINNERACWTAPCHVHPETQSVLGVLDIGVSLEQMDQRVAASTRNALIFGLVSVVLVCVLVGLFLHHFVGRPVRKLLAGTQRVAAGDLDFNIPVVSDDEVGQLATSFNQMTEDLTTARAKIRSWVKSLEHKMVESNRELNAAQAQVVRSERLSSIGMLAAGVAHELNSPLSGILTFAHLLMKKFPPGSQEREDLELIVSETNRCARIIRQLLDFSRKRTAERKLRAVHPIIDQAVSLVENQALYHNIQVQRDFGDLPDIMIDDAQFQQVVLNMLINAGEAMPDGGVLTIRTRLVPTEGNVRIIFNDTGCGIPPEAMARIFDPFYTSKEVGKGTGLGLAVSHGIIEQHRGTIQVESAVDEGTTFTITLPANAEHEPDEAEHDEESKNLSRR